MREGWGSYPINRRPYMNGMPPYAVGMPSYPVEKGSEPCGKGVRTLWKEGRYPVERGSAPCGKRVGTLWKGGRYPVERGSVPCGNGSINWFFLFQPLTYPLPTCTILSQAAEKYDSKMFIRSKIMGNRGFGAYLLFLTSKK